MRALIDQKLKMKPKYANVANIAYVPRHFQWKSSGMRRGDRGNENAPGKIVELNQMKSEPFSELAFLFMTIFVR